MDATALERDAVQFARLAVQRDHEGRYSEAVFYYKVGLTSASAEFPESIGARRGPRRGAGSNAGATRPAVSLFPRPLGVATVGPRVSEGEAAP